MGGQPLLEAPLAATLLQQQLLVPLLAGQQRLRVRLVMMLMLQRHCSAVLAVAWVALVVTTLLQDLVGW